jgi:hypothetical protein
MEHLAAQPLVDFVRGVCAPPIARGIKAHLDAGCSKCQTALHSWNRVRHLAAQEDSYTPPENLVHMAKFAFVSQAAQRVQSDLPTTWTLANLIFNGFTQPLPAGYRSGTLNVWQVIYEAEGLTVDLRFGRRSQSKVVYIVGQILDKHATRALHSDTTVELSTENDQLVATSPITVMGEFHIEFQEKGPLWLSVKTSGRNPVRIPLANPALG